MTLIVNVIVKKRNGMVKKRNGMGKNDANGLTRTDPEIQGSGDWSVKIIFNISKKKTPFNIRVGVIPPYPLFFLGCMVLT